MKFTPAFYVTALLGGLLALSGCATQNAPVSRMPDAGPQIAAAEPVAAIPATGTALPVAAKGLVSRPWALRSLPFSVADRGAGLREAFVIFRPDTGRMEGHTGCNPIRAAYQSEGQTLRIRDIQGSSLPCADGVTFEALFIYALSYTRQWSLSGSRLILKDEEGGDLAVFEGRAP